MTDEKSMRPQGIRFPSDLYSRIRNYSRATGVPISKVIRRAVADWLDVAEKKL